MLVIELIGCSILSKIIYRTLVFLLQNVLYLHRLSDGSRTRELPLDIGSIVGYSGKKHQSEVIMNQLEISIVKIMNYGITYLTFLLTHLALLSLFQIFYQFTSFLTPGIIYHCDMAKENAMPKVNFSCLLKGFYSLSIFFNSFLLSMLGFP